MDLDGGLKGNIQHQYGAEKNSAGGGTQATSGTRTTSKMPPIPGR